VYPLPGALRHQGIEVWTQGTPLSAALCGFSLPESSSAGRSEQSPEVDPVALAAAVKTWLELRNGGGAFSRAAGEPEILSRGHAHCQMLLEAFDGLDFGPAPIQGLLCCLTLAGSRNWSASRIT